MSHIYNSDFYEYISSGSRESAKIVIPVIRKVLSVESLLDVGAGAGAWSAEWLKSGAADLIAIDGGYVKAADLLIPEANFLSHDLSQGIDLRRKFDLVQSLEVAEHIAAENADRFVETLITHGDVILFSAAVPGQGGEHHLNEQPPEYWRRKFAAHGYEVFDWLRPQLVEASDVQPWYRYNSVIYANAAGQQRLAAEVLAARVPDGEALKITGSVSWRLRCTVVGLMPDALVLWIATANAKRKAALARRLAA